MGATGAPSGLKAPGCGTSLNPNVALNPAQFLMILFSLGLLIRLRKRS